MARKRPSSWLSLGAAWAACLLSTAPVAQAGATPQADRVVAQGGGQSLTQRDVDQLLVLYEWMLESPLSPAERSSMTAILIREFGADPAKAAKNYAALRQQLPQILSMSSTHQARRRAEILKGVAQAQRTDPYMAEILKLLAKHTSVLAITGSGVLTQPQIDAMVACNDNVAQAANLPKASAAERVRFAREVTAAFPGMNPKSDAFESVADAEERCFSLRDFVESSRKNHDAVFAVIRAQVHGPRDVATATRKLENNALMLSRMQTFVEQEKIIRGVVAAYEGRIAAIRAASDSFSWHESRAYAHGEAKPGAPSGFGPD